MEMSREEFIAQLEEKIAGLTEIKIREELLRILDQVRHGNEESINLQILSGLVDAELDVQAGRVYTHEEVVNYFRLRQMIRRRAS